MTGITAKAPWKDHLEGLPFHVDYFSGSMYQAVKTLAEKYPHGVAFDFQGSSTTYRKMVRMIERCAKAFRTIGIREGDRVTIALPNCPQAIYSLYALNCIGAIANMIHPLSAEKEIEFYLIASESVMVITLDQFYAKFEAVREHTHVINVVLTSIKDALALPVRMGYALTEGRKVPKVPTNVPVIHWNTLMTMARSCHTGFEVEKDTDDVAVILYSGGTTGTTKGIELTNGNFNALASQIVAANPMFEPGDKMLAAMPSSMALASAYASTQCWFLAGVACWCLGLRPRAMPSS